MNGKLWKVDLKWTNAGLCNWQTDRWMENHRGWDWRQTKPRTHRECNYNIGWYLFTTSYKVTSLFCTIVITKHCTSSQDSLEIQLDSSSLLQTRAGWQTLHWPCTWWENGEQIKPVRIRNIRDRIIDDYFLTIEMTDMVFESCRSVHWTPDTK